MSILMKKIFGIKIKMSACTSQYEHQPGLPRIGTTTDGIDRRFKIDKIGKIESVLN